MQASSTRKTWLILSALLLLFIVISYVINARQPEAYPAYVSESPSPTGTKGIYTYLEKERGTVGRWTSSPSLLPESAGNQLLLMIEPSFLNEEEMMNAYLDFIDAGNTILLFKENPHGMFSLRTVQAEIPSEEVGNLTGEDAQYQADLSPVRLEPEEEDEVVLEDKAGAIAIRRPIGNGELIAVTEPDWLTNENILDADHTELVFSLLDEAGTAETGILFDEYSHTGQGAGSFVDLFPKWLVVFAIQVVLLAALWLWHNGKRFGQVVTPREETVRFSDERLTAVAAWYQRGHQYRDALAVQADYLKLLLQEVWGIPYNSAWTEVSSQLGKKSRNMPESEMAAFTSGLEDVLRKPDLNKHEFLQWAEKIDGIRKEVERR